MTPREVAALLAYVVRLDPRMNVEDQAAAADRLAQWCDLLSDVPAIADGWDAARTARDYISRNPYRIQPSDISRPWHVRKADLLNRHAGTFEPTQHPEIDPDDETGNAYVRALRAERRAVALGQKAPYTNLAITAGPLAADVEHRLKQLGTYMPKSVKEVLADYRPHRAERERRAALRLPDPLDVACPHEECRAPKGRPCKNFRGAPRRAGAHFARTDRATIHLANQQQETTA
ncbi:cell surface glycoprotein [Streptomyces sp. NPDC017615]|uniref:zinc finger domain-containing protein n=1 Tax=Streptomyces sp. NPDC017615 TaxID=3365003 RepID=UPI0037BAA46A